MGQWGPEHVGIAVLEHYRNSNEESVLVGLDCNNRIVMHGMEV